MLLGGIGLLIVSGYLVYRLRTRLRHPFMSLIVGFPVFYSCLLASIWGSPEGYGGRPGVSGPPCNQPSVSTLRRSATSACDPCGPVACQPALAV